MSQEQNPNNASLCGLWPRCSLIKAVAFLGTAGRGDSVCTLPVPFTPTKGEAVLVPGRDLLLGELRNACGRWQGYGAWLRVGSTHPLSR